MNTFTFTQRRFSARLFAALTIFSLLLSAFPAAFFVAEAARTGVVVSALSATTVSLSEGVRLQAQVQDDGTKTDSAQVILSDGGGGGTFSNANANNCTSELGVGPQSLSVGSGTSNKNFCYSNSNPGIYTVNVELQQNGIQVGDSSMVEVTIEANTETEKKVDICHWNNGNGYIPQNVSINSLGNGHGNSGVNQGDIIPAIPDLFPEGFNWDWGHAWFNNNCEEPLPTPVDVCSNIDGIQETLPSGYEFDGVGICVEIQPEPEQCTNLLINGSFEEPIVTNNTLWQKFGVVTGWAIEKVSDNSATTLELHRDWSSNEAAEGKQYAELDGDYSTLVKQSVATLPGGFYELSWAFAPRHNIAVEQNQLSVRIEGVEVDTEGPATGSAGLTSSDWTRSSYGFVATDNSTDISFADIGPSNSYGTFLDDARLCLVREPVPQPTVCTVKLTSNDTNTVVEKGGAFAKVLTFVHNAWTTTLVDADWIWGDDGVTDPTASSTQTFVNKFGWGGDVVTGATLTIAADNSFSADLNGALAGEDLTEFNFGSTKNYDVTSLINAGNNDLEVVVKNFALANSNPKTNPAGLYYELVITGEGENCDVPYIPEPEEPKYGPYCGDGVINQEWEQCDSGYLSDGYSERQVGCSEQCQFVTGPICTDLTLAKINVENVENRTGGVGNMTNDLYLGQGLLPIPNNVWFMVSWNGSYVNDADISSYEDVPGLAVQRLDGSVRSVMYGSQKAVDEEHADGTVTLWSWDNSVEATAVSSDNSGNNKLEGNYTDGSGIGYTNAGDDEISISGGVAKFWLTTTTADDGFYTEYSEPVMCELPPVDVCINLEGNQSTIPDGYEDVGDGICEPISIPVDVCINLEGDQSEIPSGYESDGEGGCRLVEQPPVLCTDDSALNYNEAEVCEYSTVEEEDNGRSYSSGTRVKKPAPQVLGAATTNFCPFITEYMQMGAENNRWEVMKLQLFLNMFVAPNPVTGFFGSITDANVKTLQEKYHDEIIAPWFERGIVPHHEPTGFVYKTTLWKINSIICPDYAVTPNFEGEDLRTNVALDVNPIND